MHPSALLELLASTTWRTINRSARNRIQYGEDAITSVNLNALASSPDQTVVVEDTRVDEATKGCDFEFWIGSDHLGWARYAIQAKKISLPTSSYSKLGHKVGSSLQVDVLDSYAVANRAAPLYCFYNYSTKDHGWNCNLPKESEQLGCSVTPSSVVRAHLSIRGARSFQAIHANKATLPWRCLVRCPLIAGFPALSHPGWPDRKTYFHEKLPRSIYRLMQDRSAIALIDAPDAFNMELGLQPRWIAVLDTANYDNPRANNGIERTR